jgi:hypothetical protein
VTSRCRVARILLGPAVALALSACNDTAGPEPAVTITLNLTQLNGPDVFETAPGEFTIECVPELSASATGLGRATWLDATLLFYAGPDRETALDSVVLQSDDIQGSWGHADIGPGETQQSTWRLSASIPFGATFVYRYRQASGAVDTAQVGFSCGPSVPPGTPPPTISELTLQPPSGEVESGSTLNVHYTASSDIGLWTTRVRLSGACALEQTFAERLEHSVTRTASFALPATCTLGAVLSVEVVATDAALQPSQRRLPSALRVVDRTPPTVGADYLPAATSIFFTGDTLRPFVWAFDNNAVRAVIWEVGGIRDSLVGGGGRYIAIPIRAEWAGTRVQVRLFARDASGLVSDTMVAPAAGLPIYPTVVRPTRWAMLPGDVQDLVFDEARGVLYFRQAEGSVRLAIFSVATLSITETIPLATGAEDMDLTPGGESLILALPYSRALGVIDLRQSSKTVAVMPIRSLDSAAGQAPWRVRVAANGKAYVLLDGPAPAPSGLLEVDLMTGAERLVPGTDNTSGAALERSFDRTVLVLARGTNLLRRYDVALDAFSPIRAPASVYGPLRVDGSGARITLGLDVYDADLGFLRRITSAYGGEAVPGAALSVDGAYLHQAMGYRGVARTSTTDGSVLDRVATPFAASGYLRISPGGSTLVVLDSFISIIRIALVDLR